MSAKDDSKLTHLNAKGEAHMVDVGAKAATERRAVAEGFITMQPETLDLVLNGNNKKGDVLAVARIAGIMAAKKTSELIPLCHPIALTSVEVDLRPDTDKHHIHCVSTARTTGQTGVEMEALTATQVALLTIYDMCKAVDRGMAMTDVRLLEKTGGKSGSWKRNG